MEDELAAVNFEQTLLQLCLEANAKRVAVPLQIDKIDVPGVNADQPIQYIIFDKGGDDLRRYHNYRNEIDYLFNLTVLRHVAAGLLELHELEIAHQDLKPSNVVLYPAEDATRIVDLGRASHRPKPVWHDANKFAGDRGYAPIEVIYQEENTDWYVRRLAGDLYMLGSLITFLYTGVNLTARLLTFAQPQFRPDQWSDPYPQVVPYLRDALRKALSAHECFRTPEGLKIAQLIRELCDPDPLKRGSPLVGLYPSRYSMRRYLSIFDRMIQQARIKGPAV